MPLIAAPFTQPTGATIALWQMTESEDEMYALYPSLTVHRETIAAFRSVSRRRESLVVRALLLSMGIDAARLTHTASGVPVIDGGPHISISHTRGYAAVIASPSRSVAIDIEYPSDRVERIVGAYLRADEAPQTLTAKLLHWCAKETLYKLHTADDLHFDEMRVTMPEGDMSSEGTLLADNLRRGVSIPLGYAVTNEWVLTWAAPSNLPL